MKFIGELFLIKVLPEILVQLCATTMLFKTIQADLIQNNGFSNVFENNLEGIIILYDLGLLYFSFFSIQIIFSLISWKIY